MSEQVGITIKSNISEYLNTTDQSEYVSSYILVSYSIRYPLLLTFEIPSMVCYLFVIDYILTNKSLHSAPNNYVMLFILFISFVIICLDSPFAIDLYRRHVFAILSSLICLMWYFIDLCLFYTCQILVAWASFERHILIFHDHLLNQKRKNLHLCFISITM